MRAVAGELAVEAVARLERDLLAGPTEATGSRSGCQRLCAPVAGILTAAPPPGRRLPWRPRSPRRPGARLPELVQGDDRAQAVAVEDGRDDLRGEPAVGVEHPLKGRVVVGRAAVVLDDLPSLLQLEHDGLRPEVDRALSRANPRRRRAPRA